MHSVAHTAGVPNFAVLSNLVISVYINKEGPFPQCCELYMLAHTLSIPLNGFVNL